MDVLAVVEETERLLKPLEGCRLVAYLCPAGVWTIGWGETKGIREGMEWTQEYADLVLRKRVTYFLLQTVNRCPRLLAEPDYRAVACTLLSYNIGLGAFNASTVKRRTMRQEYSLGAAAFLLWNKIKGRVSRGLTIRRRLERKVYLGEIHGN